MILNVCEQLEANTGIDAWIFRIVFLLAAFASYGAAAIVYLILYFILK